MGFLKLFDHSRIASLPVIRMSSTFSVRMAAVLSLPCVSTQGSDDVGVNPITSRATLMVSYRWRGRLGPAIPTVLEIRYHGFFGSSDFLCRVQGRP